MSYFAFISVKIGHTKYYNLKVRFFFLPPPLLDSPTETFLANSEKKVNQHANGLQSDI